MHHKPLMMHQGFLTVVVAAASARECFRSVSRKTVAAGVSPAEAPVACLLANNFGAVADCGLVLDASARIGVAASTFAEPSAHSRNIISGTLEREWSEWDERSRSRGTAREAVGPSGSE